MKAQPLSTAQQMSQAYRARKVVWLIGLFIIAIVVWAAFSQLDEVVVGEGKVVPSQAVQVIQSLEGGLIDAVLVKQGEQVEQGQVLVRLNDTYFRAANNEASQQYHALLAKQLRLKAELNSVTIDDEQDVTLNLQNIVASKMNQPLAAIPSSEEIQAQATYRSRLQQLKTQLQRSSQQVEQQMQALNEMQSATQTLLANLDLSQREYKLISDMVKAGSMAEIEELKLKKEVVSLQGEVRNSRLSEKRMLAAYSQAVEERVAVAREFRSRAAGELDETSNQLAQLSESKRSVADQLQRTQIRSPVNGKVKDILVRTVGGVVKPGEPIMEIVPLDDQLVIEARVAPKDIAFVLTEMNATVKFSAYDFIVYGGLSGKVTHVSADALEMEDGSPYYRVHVLTETNLLHQRPIIPGMQATVDILTGKKTVLSYWLKPLLRARATSLREP